MHPHPVYPILGPVLVCAGVAAFIVGDMANRPRVGFVVGGILAAVGAFFWM